MNFLKRGPAATSDLTTLLRRPAHRPKAFFRSVAGTGLDPLARIAAGLAITCGSAARGFD